MRQVQSFLHRLPAVRHNRPYEINDQADAGSYPQDWPPSPENKSKCTRYFTNC